MITYAMLMIEIETEDLAQVNPDEIEAMANAGLPENITVIGSTIRESLPKDES